MPGVFQERWDEQWKGSDTADSYISWEVLGDPQEPFQLRKFCDSLFQGKGQAGKHCYVRWVERIVCSPTWWL